MAIKPVPGPVGPVSSSVPSNWTEELATQFWGEDDATTVFANPIDADLLSPLPDREPARKPRPRGRARPGPRSPGFGGVWLSADAVAEAPARPRALGHRLAIGLVIFGAGLAAGTFLLEGPLASLRADDGPPATAAAVIPGPPAAAPMGSSAPEPVVASPEASAMPAAAKMATKMATKMGSPWRKAHRGRKVAAGGLETAEGGPSEAAAQKSIVKIDGLDLTQPDPAGP